MASADVLVLSEQTLSALTGCATIDQSRRMLLDRGVASLCVLRGEKGYCYMTRSQVLCEGGYYFPHDLRPESEEQLFSETLAQLLQNKNDMAQALHHIRTSV